MDGDAASGVPAGGVLSAFAEAIVTGADSLKAEPYLAYIKQKYSEIYGL